MSFSMYDMTVPAMTRALGVLDTLIDRAAAFATERDIGQEVLINARLAPDMLPFSGQVQRVSDTCKGTIARLTSLAMPSFPDTETTFEQLKKRVADTAALLQRVTPADFEGSETKVLDLNFRALKGRFSGGAYVVQYMLPNMYFHLATAYDILRHNGVPLGKVEYLGKVG